MPVEAAVSRPAAETGCLRWRMAHAAGLRFRPAEERDRPFLVSLYASTRQEELAQTGWPPAQQSAFLEQQFTAQHEHYRRHYAGADFLVIEHGGSLIGRLYLARWPSEHRIVDIAFLPEARGGGRGTALLSDLTEEAHALGRSLSIHVERMNRALSLYQRLGFGLVEDKGVYLLLEIAPDRR
jgi:GNAT superfamily N-acetyltransferase